MIMEQAVQSPIPPNINWHEVCQAMLDHALPINPFTTHPEESPPEEKDVPLFLETREGKRYTWEQFLDRLRDTDAPESERAMAIVGPSGSGKTFFLHQIAQPLLAANHFLPIQISVPESRKLSLRQYLYDRWLPRAAKLQSLPSETLSAEFETLLESGQICFLVDGGEDLAFLAEYRAGWAARSRVILTSRHPSEALDNFFQVYRLLPLAYPSEVKRFILHWFPRRSLEGESRIGDHLWERIETFGPDRLRECFETPLRLSLLCRLWQECHPNFPTTRTGLYRQLTRQFYQWQAENVMTTGEQQQKIEGCLGQLARQTPTAAVPLSHPLVAAAFAEYPSLLALTLRLGWLIGSETPGKNPQETVYRFLDQAFRDYFASLAIEDWRVFLPPFPENGQESGDRYPIFEEQWKRVILFWLGDSERADADKNAFLDALIEFPDRCGSWSPYRKRAYFLAAAALAEYDRYERADEIIRQILRWAFQDQYLPSAVVEAARHALQESDRQRVITTILALYPPAGNFPKEILCLIEKIGSGHPSAIASLNERLENALHAATKCQLAESLHLIAPQHPRTLQTPLSLLEQSSDDDLRHLALSSWERMAKADRQAFAEIAPPAIAALARLLQVGSPTLTRRAFACLETIGQGNATAIAALVQLIRTTRDPLVHCQAAESLDRIDPGNPTAITVLSRLLQTAPDESTRQQAVYRLGEITPGNRQAIAALVNLLATDRNDYTSWLAISSLGKVGAGAPQAIEALVQWVQTSDRPLLQRESIDSLVKIAPDHPVSIHALASLVQSSEDNSLRWEAAKTLGKIDPGNPVAIAALSEALQEATDEFTRRQVAVYLGTIDPGNLEAILALVGLIRSSQDSDIRSLAMESVGEIGMESPVAIATLIRCLETEREPKLLKLAARSLGYIARGQGEAIAVLSRLGRSNAEESVRIQAFESLSGIVPPARLPELVSDLAAFLATSHPDRASQLLLWKCSGQLSYADFYRAWHASKATPVSIETDFPALLP
jgi:HEAT repeat protein